MTEQEKAYHSALSQCAELLENMPDGHPITDTPRFLAAKLEQLHNAGAARQGGNTNETSGATQPLDAAALDKLEALAKAATPGPWSYEAEDNMISYEGYKWIAWQPRSNNVGMPQRCANGAYIAAANPQTILALIAQARAAQTAQTLDEAHLKQLVLDVSNASYFCGTDPERDGPAYAEKLDKAASAEAALIQYVQTIVRAAQAHHAAATTDDARAVAALPGWERGIATVTMNGHQLREALDFINPDGDDDPDQREDELTFGVVRHKDNDGNESTGLCCWNDDTDGVLPLDGAAPNAIQKEGDANV